MKWRVKAKINPTEENKSKREKYVKQRKINQTEESKPNREK